MIKYSIRVIYPLQSGRIVLRTDQDWDRDIEPERWDSAEGRFEFQLETDRSFLYFKPVLLDQGKPRWSQGENYLAIASTPRTIYPHFQPDSHCSVCELQQLESHQYRVFFPPGYEENRLKRYPVLYMHDGQNLFFPEEAFLGSDWMIGSTLTTLEAMNMIDRVIVVGIHPLDRMVEYTRDGYLEYGRFIVEALKPRIDATYRTLRDPAKTAVMGSSLGGVASLYLSWQWPEVFGNAACLSSTFTYNDDLMERVSTEPMRKIRLYLDSGWPGDNYEVTRAVRDLLVRRGYQPGVDLMYLAFPNALHNEQSWAMRSHIPFQFFFGKLTGASGVFTTKRSRESGKAVDPRVWEFNTE